ncbi:hypothetical protein ABW20_dc0110694 [Dactylellina cionopaga]|nr:hypothetical protein ABW20_dc0110694 [Dactylellina cionopaga]
MCWEDCKCDACPAQKKQTTPAPLPPAPVPGPETTHTQPTYTKPTYTQPTYTQPSKPQPPKPQPLMPQPPKPQPPYTQQTYRQPTYTQPRPNSVAHMDQLSERLAEVKTTDMMPAMLNPISLHKKAITEPTAASGPLQKPGKFEFKPSSGSKKTSVKEPDVIHYHSAYDDGKSTPVSQQLNSQQPDSQKPVIKKQELKITNDNNLQEERSGVKKQEKQEKPEEMLINFDDDDDDNDKPTAKTGAKGNGVTAFDTNEVLLSGKKTGKETMKEINMNKVDLLGDL